MGTLSTMFAQPLTSEEAQERARLKELLFSYRYSSQANNPSSWPPLVREMLTRFELLQAKGIAFNRQQLRA